jgi:hypothetical protein
MSRGGATSGDRPEPLAESAGGGHGEAAGGGRSESSAGERSAPAAGRRSAAGRARAGRPGTDGQVVPVTVSWDERLRRPVAFVWRRRTYRVERVLETWILETGWWKDDGHISCSYWRVRAGGRVVDLRYDRLGRAWALERVLS